ncbi:hypothetical protein ACHELU_004528 [Vibrio vulnificus]
MIAEIQSLFFKSMSRFSFLGFGFCMQIKAELILVLEKRKSLKLKHNKRFKRDSQRAAFLLCVGFCGYGVMRKLGNGVGCPLTGRYSACVARSISLQYFDLPDLSSVLLKKLGVKDLIKVRVSPDVAALPRNCLNNVNSYIERHGGSVQLGWIFSCLGNNDRSRCC